MIVLLSLVACAGDPPFPDGRPSDTAEAAGVSIVAVDRAAVEDPDNPSPLELMDADGLSEEGGEAVGAPAPELTLEPPSGLVMVDPALLVRPTPPRPLVRLADEILAALTVLGALLSALVGFVKKVWPRIQEIAEHGRRISEEYQVLAGELRATREAAGKSVEEATAKGAALARVVEENAALRKEVTLLRAERPSSGLASQRTIADDVQRTRQRGQDALT